MNFSAEGFSLVWLVSGFVLLVSAVFWSIVKAPWSKLTSDSESQHVFIGTTMVLVIAWLGEASLNPGMGFHILLLTTVTLMFGPQFAILSGLVALISVTLIKGGSWLAFGLSGSVLMVLPVLLVWIFTMLSYRYLEKNFFIFILFNGFFVAALSTILVLFTSAAVLYYAGVYPIEKLSYEFLPYIPIMVFPEAFINGLAVISLVVMKPGWLSCFDDDVYLKGK